MSDFAALEILASINRLASEIKSINPTMEVPWYKTYIALISGLAGATLVFIYNWSRDSWSNYKKSKIYKSAIDEEMDIIRSEMLKHIPMACKMLDSIHETGELKVYVHSPEITSVCYDKFFPDIMVKYTSFQRRKIMRLYSKVKEVNAHNLSLKAKFVKLESKSDGLASAFFFLTSCINCHVLLNEIQNDKIFKDEYEISEILVLLEIKSSFMDHLDTLPND